MDGKNRWADNVMIERRFLSLKTELIYINEFRSPKQLRQTIRAYIEDYDNLRPHEALGVLLRQLASRAADGPVKVDPVGPGRSDVNVNGSFVHVVFSISGLDLGTTLKESSRRF